MGPKLSVGFDFMPDLDENQAGLMESLIEAHQQAAISNSNASSLAIVMAYPCSGSFASATISAICNIGQLHAPLIAARSTYRHATQLSIQSDIESGHRIPGFGNSFYRNCVDPTFLKFSSLLARHYPASSARIEELSACMWEVLRPSRLYPNAALYTAAACEVCGVPDGVETAIFMVARIPIWASIAINGLPGL